MKLEDQVCTLKQAKRLKKLGVSGESLLYWAYAHNWDNEEEYRVVKNPKPHRKLFSAFTVAELGVMLPDSLTIGSYRMHVHSYKQEYNTANSLWTVTMGRPEDKEVPDFDSHSEAEAKAALLIYLLENNFTTAEEVNKRLLNA